MPLIAETSWWRSPSLYVEFWYNDSAPEGITIDFEQYQKLKDVDQLLPTLLQDLNIRLPCEFDVVESVSRANLAYDGEIDCSLTILQCYSVLCYVQVDISQVEC
jgi:hypothetical protein